MSNVQDTLKDVVGNVQQSAQDWSDDLKDRVAKQAAQQAAKHEAKVDKVMAEQHRMIHDLRVQVNTLMRTRRRGGGLPIFPLLLVGGAVYLYRSNPSVRDQINSLLDRVNPSIRGNLTRAGDAAKDAVQALSHGDSPKGAVQDAAGELKRAGEKALDRTVDQAHDLGEAVKRGTENSSS